MKKSFDFAVPTFVKTGLQYQDQRRERENKQHRYTYVGLGGIGQFRDKASWVNKTIEGMRQGPWVDPFYVSRIKGRSAGVWPEDLSFKHLQYLQSLD